MDNNTRRGTAAASATAGNSEGDIEGSGALGPSSNFGCLSPLPRMQEHRERPRRKPALAQAVVGYLLFLVVVQHSRRRSTACVDALPLHVHGEDLCFSLLFLVDEFLP